MSQQEIERRTDIDILAKASEQERRKVKFCSFIFIVFIESVPGYNHYTLIVISGLWEEREIVNKFFNNRVWKENKTSVVSLRSE